MILQFNKINEVPIIFNNEFSRRNVYKTNYKNNAIKIHHRFQRNTLIIIAFIFACEH